MEATSTLTYHCSNQPKTDLIEFGQSSFNEFDQWAKRNTKLPPINTNDHLERRKTFVMTNRDDSSQVRIKQLERDFEFVKEQCHLIIKCLHKEVEDVKMKNRGK